MSNASYQKLLHTVLETYALDEVLITANPCMLLPSENDTVLGFLMFGMHR